MSNSVSFRKSRIELFVDCRQFIWLSFSALTLLVERKAIWPTKSASTKQVFAFWRSAVGLTPNKSAENKNRNSNSSSSNSIVYGMSTK